MKNINVLLKAALLIAVMILFGSLAQESRAASFTVNSTLDIPDFDAGDGSCQTINARQCTLRAAISEANALAGDDIIFLPAGIYITTRSTLGDDANVGGDFDITSNITINGAGAGSTFIQAASSAGAATERVLHFVAGTSTVNGVTIRYGRDGVSGGGVYTGSNTNVTLNAVTISNNVDEFFGGGIVNSGTLTLTNSTVSGNSASFGGGIGNESGGMLTLTNTLISNNTALGFEGGGIFNFGTITLTNSTVSGNLTSFDDGGGIFSYGTMTLTDSTVSNNQADLDGGGIHSFGMLTLMNSTVSGNTASGVGGGIFCSSCVEITNSTVSNNSAGEGGGGIYSGGLLTLTSSTVSGNSSLFGGGIYIAFSGTANLDNTIIANSVSGGDCLRDNGGVTINARYSLIEGGLSCVNGININNLIGDPLLGPLQDNGGPTPTHALLPGSPAIDKGNSFSLTTDQRGLTRPVDIPSISNASDGADIGAFEMQALAPTAASVSVSGRVLADGVGVYGAVVTMTDAFGVTRSARTNPFGYYSFTEVPAGATYIFNVFSKQYSFSPQVVTVFDEMTDLNFTMGN
jgi:CSLREA domain-containing protein